MRPHTKRPCETDNIRETLKVENVTARCRKAPTWFGHVKRRAQKEKDRIRYGWTVPAETREPSERQHKKL